MPLANREPPNRVHLDLEEALELLAALKEARDALLTTDHLAEGALCFEQIRLLSHKLGFESPEGGGPMPTEPLRAAEAARRLGLPTKELLRLVHERKIRFVMVDGVAHFPEDVITEHAAKAS